MGILIENLTKRFGEKTVISELTCSLPDKGIVKVCGSSGAGKTTLMRMISGLDTDYSGCISGCGTVSYLFQEHRLFPWLSAVDNVAVAAFAVADQEAKAIAEKMLMRLGFSAEEAALKPSKLSGGMKQRVSIARALLKKSDIIILDEPTKELDTALVDTVKGLILEAAESRLVLLVSHDSTLDDIDFAYEVQIK